MKDSRFLLVVLLVWFGAIFASAQFIQPKPPTSTTKKTTTKSSSSGGAPAKKKATSTSKKTSSKSAATSKTAPPVRNNLPIYFAVPAQETPSRQKNQPVKEAAPIPKVEEKPVEKSEVEDAIDIINKTVDKINKDLNERIIIDRTSMNVNVPVSMAVVEQKPQFPGGDAAMMKWLSSNINYPPQAAEEGVEGKVQVSFVVEKDGKISNVTIARGKHPALDAEAKRVVSKMPKWQPGKNYGIPVPVIYILPVSFKLP